MIRCFPLESVYSRNEKIEETRKKQGDGVLCVLRAADGLTPVKVKRDKITEKNLRRAIRSSDSLCLSDKHCVSERKESILFFYRGVIGVKKILSAGEGGNKHDKSAFGKVEIRYKSIDNRERIAGIDKNIGRTTGIFKRFFFEFFADGFKNSAGGRSDGDNAASVFFCGIYYIGC